MRSSFWVRVSEAVEVADAVQRDREKGFGVMVKSLIRDLELILGVMECIAMETF